MSYAFRQEQWHTQLQQFYQPRYEQQQKRSRPSPNGRRPVFGMYPIRRDTKLPLLSRSKDRGDKDDLMGHVGHKLTKLCQWLININDVRPIPFSDVCSGTRGLDWPKVRSLKCDVSLLESGGSSRTHRSW